MASREGDLADRIAELETALEELRDELRPRRGPFRGFRPPTPRELLRVTDEYAIPAAITALEANIRALELLQRAIRVTDPARTAERGGGEVRERATALSRATLDRLDRALADIESAIEGSGLPRDPEARELLEEARSLNDEIRGQVGEPGEDEAVEIDVESELESIKDEVDGDGEEPTEE